MPRRQQDQTNPQLAQLLQLAQIQQAFSQPDQEDAQLAQRAQEQKMSAAIQLMGLMQGGEEHASALNELKSYHEGQLKDSAATLAEQSKYHEGELKHLKSALEQASSRDKENTFSTVFSEIARSNPEAIPYLAKVAKAHNMGEAATALDQQNEEQTQKRVAAHLISMHSDPKGPENYLNVIKNDPTMTPDIMNRLRKHVPKVSDSTPTESSGAYYGTIARKLLGATQFGPATPFVLPATIGVNAAQDFAARHRPALNDFIDSFLNRKTQPAK